MSCDVSNNSRQAMWGCESKGMKVDALEGALIGAGEGFILSMLFAAAHLDSGVTEGKVMRAVNVAAFTIAVCAMIGISLSVLAGVVARRLK